MPQFVRCDKCSGTGYMPKPNSKVVNELTVCNKCSRIRKQYPILPEGWIVEK
jgi:hypothetical protein